MLNNTTLNKRKQKYYTEAQRDSPMKTCIKYRQERKILQQNNEEIEGLRTNRLNNEIGSNSYATK